MNVLLTEDGQHYQRTDLNGGRALVIDIGGFTTDWIAVNPGGEVDYSLARSVPLGIQSVLADFEESFKANNLKAVKDTPVLPPERVRKAIATGFFGGGGDCDWMPSSSPAAAAARGSGINGSETDHTMASPCPSGHLSACCEECVQQDFDFSDCRMTMESIPVERHIVLACSPSIPNHQKDREKGH